eukprot:gnl/TRDRNA2_/TRDRNA2_175706_c15_seq1.p2 gnl/TRDRNA2_/TRDRNA2_175706_c15~~gnl/TRDRNA2_/TRDRNA2_175706_c15_seq1.p2  ORF type:complete len:120 (+),score=15.51 gnl/TRDRNA2_/TRDRNA2_175706_c15_seq1:83-442(+)
MSASIFFFPRAAALASLLNSDESTCVISAKAHAALARACGWKTSARQSVAAAKVLISEKCSWPAFADAQSMLLMACTSRSSTDCSTACASVEKSSELGRPAVHKAHARFASSRALKLSM